MIAVLAAALLAAPATPPKSLPAKPVCQNGELLPVSGTPRIGTHKLSQEPPARQLYTVLRIEDGCAKPVYVNDRVIGGQRR